MVGYDRSSDVSMCR